PPVSPLLPYTTLFRSASTTSSLGFSGGLRDAWGRLFTARQPCAAPSMPPKVADSVRRWNAITNSANALDHTPVASGENRVFGEQDRKSTRLNSSHEWI